MCVHISIVYMYIFAQIYIHISNKHIFYVYIYLHTCMHIYTSSSPIFFVISAQLF